MQALNIKQTVQDYYHNKNFNCSTTMLLSLGRQFEIKLEQQVVDSAIGMHGAGKYRAQCGLVEGALLFIGIYGRHLKIKDKDIVKLCYIFAEGFEKKFTSLSCRDLRPGGFNEDDPEHLCETLTVDAIEWTINYITNNFI